MAIILLIKRRAYNLNKILMTLFLTMGCALAIFYGVSEFLQSGIIGSHLSQKKLLAFANALVEEGAYDEADEVISQYSEAYGYDDDCRLLNARIALLEEDYERANGIYEYLCENTDMISKDAEEVAFAARKAKASLADLVMIEYLQSAGENIEDYGYTQTSYDEIKEIAEDSADDIRRKVRNAIEEDYSISDEALNCARAVAGVAESYSNLLEDGQNPTSRYRRAFSEIENSSPEYLSLECVNKARIKAYVLAGDYDAITQNLDSNSSYHELMIASELYMSGLVKKSDFPDEYQKLNSVDVSAVKNQLSKIYQNSQGDVSVQERKALRARVSAISNQLDDPALVVIKEQLTITSENEAGMDRTKVYLELAKIENYFGNETSTDSYISEAIYSSQDCKDDSYVAAMAQIIAVISNDEESDTENIKNVSKYVDNVLDHSLTVNVESIVSPQYQVSDLTYENIDSDGMNDTNVDFAQTAVDYVSRIISSISIGKIDTSNFEQIVARVQIDSDYINNVNELKAAIKVYDCGAEISDFTLEKINYTGSNIILVCDVSGSMDGSIQDLRDAVVTFITDKNPSENLSVVTFNNTIVETKSFGTSDESLIAFAESMYASGGTDMFSAVVNCLGSFPTNASENNVLILMTDGQDSSPKSSEVIYSEIGNLALQKGVTVYAMGLGYDVDTAYLSTIAGSGNGEFVYVSDSASLTSFYNMLHSQVYSQYELTYQAQDTITMSGRTLEVTLPSENLRDVKTYSLGGADDSEGGLEVSQELSVSVCRHDIYIRDFRMFL